MLKRNQDITNNKNGNDKAFHSFSGLKDENMKINGVKGAALLRLLQTEQSFIQCVQCLITVLLINKQRYIVRTSAARHHSDRDLSQRIKNFFKYTFLVHDAISNNANDRL